MKLTGFFTLFLAVFTYSLSAQQSANSNQLSLDGSWEIIFDHNNEGRKDYMYTDTIPPVTTPSHWFEKQTSRQSIEVPSCWEEIEQDYEGVAFYRRKFQVPTGWKGKTVRLQFDAVNYIAEVWLNDEAIGHHEGGFTPFEFQIDDLLKYDAENSLILRVIGPILLQDKEIDGMGPIETNQWRGAITGGIWQPVRLMASGEVFVDDIFIEPKLDENVALVHLELEHSGREKKQVETEITIRSVSEPERIVARVTETAELLPGPNRQSQALEIPEAVCWSPDNPHLYTAEVTLHLGESTSDVHSVRFGMRELTIRNKAFYLNGEEIYIKAGFFEGLYPAGLANPDNEEMARREIQLAKDAGFNMIRLWRKLPPPMWLDLADEMGILVTSSMTIECMNFPIATPYLPWRVENEVRESILRDRNHACIVQWELFNEVRRPVLERLVHPMSILARILDPTRLILDESGGRAGGSIIYLPYERTGVGFNDRHSYAGSQITEDRYNYYLVMGLTKEERENMGLGHIRVRREPVPDQMTFISEIGYGSLPNLVENNKQFEKLGNPILPATRYHKRLAEDLLAALKKTGFDEVYPDLEQFCLDQQKIHGIANKRMLEAARCNPNVRGYCVHALIGGDWVLGAGLIDLWRNPKTAAYSMTKEANQPQIVSIRVLPRNVYAGEGARLQVTGVNELENVNAKVLVKIFSEKGASVFSKEFNADFPNGISDLFQTRLETVSMTGSYNVKVSLKDKDGNLITSNDCPFDVFQPGQLMAPQTMISVIDPFNSVIPYLKTSGIEYTLFDPDQDLSVPVLIGTSPPNDDDYREQVMAAREFVKKGGFVVMLNVPGKRIPYNNRKLKDTGVEELPFGAQMHGTLGAWMGRPHIVKEHPVFEGLPTNLIMRGVYENIHPTVSMIRQQGEYICGVVAYDRFPDMLRMGRHYPGPGEVFWGADVLLAPMGKGKMLLSTLRITENLGNDPVADKLLINMIQFALNNKSKI